MKAKCECKFIDLVNIELINENIYVQNIQEIFEIISELNIAVVKCYKDIFKKEYFMKNTGGFIIIVLFIGQIGCFIIYVADGLFFIRKYIFNLTKSYLVYLNKINNNIKHSPTKKKKITRNLLEKENVSAHQSKNSFSAKKKTDNGY